MWSAAVHALLSSTENWCLIYIFKKITKSDEINNLYAMTESFLPNEVFSTCHISIEREKIPRNFLE